MRLAAAAVCAGSARRGPAADLPGSPSLISKRAACVCHRRGAACVPTCLRVPSPCCLLRDDDAAHRRVDVFFPPLPQWAPHVAATPRGCVCAHHRAAVAAMWRFLSNMVIERQGRLRVTAIGDTFSTVAVESMFPHSHVVRVGGTSKQQRRENQLYVTKRRHHTIIHWPMLAGIGCSDFLAVGG